MCFRLSKFKKPKILGALGLFLVVLSVAILVSIQGKPNSSETEVGSLTFYAQRILKACAQEQYRAYCYDREIPKLMNFLTMEQSFEVTNLVQNEDKSYGYCHVLGHRLAAIETAKDPKKWTEVMVRAPKSGACANGALHGAAQERFRSETLTEAQLDSVRGELSDACEARNNWDPADLDKSICYHGIGHLTLYVTGADFSRALNICEWSSLKGDGRDYRQVCYEGLFMQAFQPTEPEDIALVEGKTPEAENLRTFCSNFIETERVEACWRQGWPLFQTLVEKPNGLVEFCNQAQDKVQQEKCFTVLFHTVGQRYNFDEFKIGEFCGSIEQSQKGNCFGYSALSILQADKRFVQRTISLCKLANQYGSGEYCFEKLADYSTYNFKLGSSELKDFCTNLGVRWEDRCLRKS